jgi:transposase
MNEQYTSQVLDHLGIVAGVCQQIGLIEQIDARMPDTGRTVSVGQAIQAMVVNGLGFVGRPLYLTPEFYANKPVDLLIGEGVEAADLNADSLGKALDYVYEAGITELFASVSVHALRCFGIQVRFAHLDTTAFSLEGAYEHTASEEDPDEPQPIRITYGYSKDRRPDLKQAILGLICVNRTSIPAYLNALSGNASDKTSMPEMAQVYLDQFEEDEETPVLVADSALYSENNLQLLSEVKWVTRVPATLNDAKMVMAAITPAEMTPAERDGYFYHEVEQTYGGVDQRWLVILYEPRREEDLAQLDKRIGKEHDDLAKQLKRLMRQTFNCAEDAQQALESFAKSWTFHTITGKVHATQRYTQRGRPTLASPTVTRWHITAHVQPDETAIAERQHLAGKYVIATNELDRERLPVEDLLTAYKDQNRSVERGFRFLKAPLFFASRFFLKKPARIMALLMVMGLSLLVYALAEYRLRTQLVETGQSIPDQKSQPTQRPTMRRVFQMFEGIHVLFIHAASVRKRLVLNVEPVHLQIAILLGEPVLKFYVLLD